MIPRDKLMHMAVGAAIFLVSIVTGLGGAVGLALAIVAGVGKELYDTQHRDVHTPDLWDALATIAPAAIGLAIVSQVERALTWPAWP
jgi:MFS superfamily sulfate permease-like transporter